MLEQWEKEKAETEREHEKKLFDMKQKVATMQAQQEEERTRVENAKQEVKAVKGEFVWVFLLFWAPYWQCFSGHCGNATHFSC